FDARVRRARPGATGAGPDGRLASPVLSGKTPDGRPRRDHGHAYYLPTDEDGDGRLDHLTVYAADGFGPDEVAALDALRRLGLGAGEPLRLVLAGLGAAADFTVPWLGAAACWESATPFVVSRHRKQRGRRRDPEAVW